MHIDYAHPAYDRDGREVQIVGFHTEDGVVFAEIKYPDGYLPHDPAGRLSGTEDDPVWEHRLLDGLVLKSGGDYYSDADWVIERGLRSYPADDPRRPS